MLDFIFDIFQVFWMFIAVGMICTTLGFIFFGSFILIQDYIDQQRVDKLGEEFSEELERFRNDIS